MNQILFQHKTQKETKHRKLNKELKTEASKQVSPLEIEEKNPKLKGSPCEALKWVYDIDQIQHTELTQCQQLNVYRKQWRY